MHAKATASGTTLAETDIYEFVEGNVYFPPASIKDKEEVFTASETRTWCPWKGEASYYDVHVGNDVIKDGAWYYPQPFEKAEHIRDHVAFYKSKIQVERE